MILGLLICIIAGMRSYLVILNICISGLEVSINVASIYTCIVRLYHEHETTLQYSSDRSDFHKILKQQKFLFETMTVTGNNPGTMNCFPASYTRIAVQHCAQFIFLGLSPVIVMDSFPLCSI